MDALCLNLGFTGREDEYMGIPNICSPYMQSLLLCLLLSILAEGLKLVLGECFQLKQICGQWLS